VKICNELVKTVKNMVSQTGPRVDRSNSSKGPAYPGKGPKKSQRAKRKFWGHRLLFGTKFLKFGPKRANLETLFIRFRYQTDFQQTNKRNGCFVTISKNIQVKHCPLLTGN